MRTFFQKSAGGTFCMGSNVTFVPRKDCVEIVIKLQSGVYAVITVLACGQDEIMFFCNWSTYFERLHNLPRPEELLGRLKKTCPKFVGLCTEDGPYALVTLPNHPDTTGIGKVVKVQHSDNFICTVAQDKHIEIAFGLANFCLSVYHELKDNCKLGDWVRSLSILWG